MNDLHFICQLCRENKKNIIFYKEIAQLLEHYKAKHFLCPYQECLDDIFVVFESEEKLNSHLITKHKCLDAQNRMANFMFDNKKKNNDKQKPLINHYNFNFSNYSNITEEFNFTEYINQLKEKVKEYSANIASNKKKYIHNEQRESTIEITIIIIPQNKYDNGYGNRYYEDSGYS